MGEYERALAESETSKERRAYWNGNCTICFKPRLECAQAMDRGEN